MRNTKEKGAEYLIEIGRDARAITLIALIVTIIVILILAGVTIGFAVNDQGIFNKAKVATRTYKNAEVNEQAELIKSDFEIDKYMPITYTDGNGKKQTLTKDTPAGTKIGTTVVNGQNLNWYVFDTDETKAYLITTPTYWVPDTTKEVNGAYVLKLVASLNSKTGAIRQAIQKKANGTSWDKYTYNSSDVSYKPSINTLNYYKNANSLWSAQRGNIDFSSLNENEQSACYLADEDIFAEIKKQVNSADGNLKGKIQTLVGGASIEQ